MQTLNWVALHGSIMVNSIFAPLIGMERAIAINKFWAYLGPIPSKTGPVVLLFGSSVGIIFIFLSSFIFLLMNNVILKETLAYFIIGEAIGAIFLVHANFLWLISGSISDAVFSWIAYLILIIASERLGLTRFTNRPVWAQYVFWIPILFILLAVFVPKNFSFLFLGIGLIGIALWLSKFDIIRLNLRQKGLSKFSALALSAGYFWLFLGGVIALTLGGNFAGPIYDVIVHSIMIGFVYSMVFAHAPSILPSILKFNKGFHWTLYIPLWLLHASLVFRAIGDLTLNQNFRLTGAIGNAIAVVLFIFLFAFVRSQELINKS
ncbi:MAG: hypothetical protein ACUVQ1_09385 [Candidatus Kapaibacteriales bacterium]